MTRRDVMPSRTGRSGASSGMRAPRVLASSRNPVKTNTWPLRSASCATSTGAGSSPGDANGAASTNPQELRPDRSHRLSRATGTGSTSASFTGIGLPRCRGSPSMRTATTCCRSSADVTVPVWPSRADGKTIRTRTPACTPESSGRGDAASLLADRHVEHVAPNADTAHMRPTVSPGGGRRRWPHSVHPSHSGSSRWTSDIAEECWSAGLLNISFLDPSSSSTRPLGIRGRPLMVYGPLTGSFQAERA